MKRVLEVVTARWLVTLIGAIALALIVWYVGPLIAIGGYRPLQSDLIRTGVVGAIFIGWGLLNINSRIQAANVNERMIDGIVGAGAGGGGSASDSEIAELRARLEEALRGLRRLRGADRRGRAYLYELPWYILIGPPGSGKTTALTHSGLNFPLAERMGRSSLRGVSGTRNCDWFLTDDAVLLDTAGRYTTQDSDEAADKAAWLGFLDLLHHFRPRQPINGAIVAISLADLITLPEGERRAHAQATRQRLAELQDRFGVRFPVYVLFTKADLVAGFVETFESLSREEREQVLGMTFPLEQGEDDDPAVSRFDGEFQAVMTRLDERMIEQIQIEPDMRRRGLIFAFPGQFVSLETIAREFLDEVFRASRYESRPLLRGVYFTSGTQEGTPIDRLVGALAERFGVTPGRLLPHGGSGRSYFLTRLLREVIFAEASLVSANPRVERRQRWLRGLAYAAVAIVLVGAGTLWTVSYLENRALEARIHTALAAAREEAAKLDAPILTDAEPSRAVPALDLLRDLPGGYADRDKPVPWTMRLGLYQGQKLGSQEIAAYRRGLNLLLLPRLLSRLQQQLQANANKPDYLYQALKICLMLGGLHPVDRAMVKEWMGYDWAAAYPGPANEKLRADLQGHLDALLDAPLTTYDLNGAIIEQARRVLRQVTLAGRAYAVLQEKAASAKLAPWRISDHAGPGADRILVRASGKLLSDGLPGFYTREGFYGFVVPTLPDAARLVEEDSWVLSDNTTTTAPTAEPLSNDDVLKLYYDDYTRRWDELIADVTVGPIRNSEQAADSLNLLTGANSPLRLLWHAIAEETKLSQPIAGAKPAAAATPPAESRIGEVLAPSVAAVQPHYGEPVDKHFRDFQEFVGGSAGGPAAMDGFLKDLSDLYQQVNRAPTPGGGGTLANAGELGAAARKVESDAAQLPPSVGAIAQKIAEGAAGASAGGTKTQINDDWQKILPLCTSALDGRYPLDRSASADVTPDDFARLFSPGGLIDTFVKNDLAPFVDTSRTPWRAQGGSLGGIALSPDSLAQFQLAARIRDSFFGTGTTPVVRFEITPLLMDSGSKRAVLSIEGQDVSYEGGSARPMVVQWPGPSGVRESEITFETTAGQKAELTRPGAWSWFRLLDAGQLESLGGPDRFRVTFTVGDSRAVYEIHAGSVINPLGLHDLDRFRCPRRL